MKKSVKKSAKKNTKKSVKKSAKKNVNKNVSKSSKKSVSKSTKNNTNKGVKKSVIAFFYLGCLCIALIPIMAYILWPLIFIYIIGAAIFFFLSRELIVMFSKKLIPKVKTTLHSLKSHIKISEKMKERMRINKPTNNVEIITQTSSIAADPMAIEENNVYEEAPMMPQSVIPEQTVPYIASGATQSIPVTEQVVSAGEEHYDEHYPHEGDHVYYDEQYVNEQERVYYDEYDNEHAYEEQEIVKNDLVGDVKKGIVNIFNKAKNTVSSVTSQRAQKSSAREVQETAITFQSMPNNADRWVSNRNENAGIDSNLDLNEVKRQLDDLDMITASAIALMLSDTKARSASPYIRTIKKPDIRIILLKFLQDSYFATDIEQINELYNKSYYKKQINKHLRPITVFIRQGIEHALPRKGAMKIARKTKNRFIEKVCESIGTFENVKYISALSENEEISESRRNYKLDHLNENYKDAMIYLMDILLTCTCISKILFVERMIKNMDENSEFNQIITNMAASITNHNVIINKSRPIYKQYYQAELGYINGDDLLYGMAITIMVNRIRKVDFGNTDILYVNTNYRSANELAEDMYMWLDEMARYNDIDNIGTLILQKVTLSVRNNYGLLTLALQELTHWEETYKQRVLYYKKELDKERYLRGNFEEEAEELDVRVRK